MAKTNYSKYKSKVNKNLKSNLSNDELLEQILQKKKEKKKSSSTKKNVKKKSNTKVNIDLPKLKNDQLNNDELFDQIMAKKKNKIKSKKIDVVNKKNIENKNDEFIEIPKIELPKPPHKPKVNKGDSFNKEFDDSYNNKIKDKEVYVQVSNKDKTRKKFFDQEKDTVFFDKPLISENNYKSTKKNKSFILILICLFIFVSFVVFIFIYYNSKFYSFKENNSNTNVALNKEKELLEKKQKYEECLNEKYSDVDNSDVISNYIIELNQYLNNYKVSVLYEDLDRGFTFGYNVDQVYYAASTIKALDALYIYTKAYNGEISLDDTLVYSKKYKNYSSVFTGTLKIGTSVSIRELVKNAIMYSDNGAHQMLIDYIGYNNLKQFGKDLGATSVLSGTDNFGYINVYDGIIYMKALNNFFGNGSDLAVELKDYFVNSDENALTMDGILAATKYGEYSPNFHNIGIVYGNHTYVISILTAEKSGDFMKKVSDINKKVYDLNELYYSNREQTCKSNIYGN